MKKEYTEPTAEKMEFEYTESVVACDSNIIQCKPNESWRHECISGNDPFWGCG